MSQHDVDDFLIIEEFDRHQLPDGGELVLPVRDRKPTDPGFVLTWTERRATGGRRYTRTGMVLARAPRQGMLWVVPAKRRRGEGHAVVVDLSFDNNTVTAFRLVGGPGDYLSTAEWQAPEKLPRALLRTDRFTADNSDGYSYEQVRLHADPTCEEPKPFRLASERWSVLRGEPVTLEHAYVYKGHLHPASAVPTGPWERLMPCGGCLATALPR